MAKKRAKRKRKNRWIQPVVERAERKGTKGAFRAQAKRAGFKSTASFARHVLSHKNRFSKTTVLRANAALNMIRARKKRLRK